MMSPEIRKLVNDGPARRKAVRLSHELFFAVYFGEYMAYPSASFHRELFRLTEDERVRLAIVTAFRGSAKSTIVTLSYAIWAALGKQGKKMVLIVSQTQQQARQHLANLKKELERNELLRRDLGPFREESDEWNAGSIVLSDYDARITAVSMEQNVRGYRHGTRRPDLVICDDVENIESVKTIEGRDKTFSWFTGEILPIGDKGTRFFVVGNLLHEDSLLMRFKKGIEAGTAIGAFRSFPLVDDDGHVAWPGKYPEVQAIEDERKLIGNDAAWQREYLLKIVPDEDRIVRREWIRSYDALPDLTKEKKRYRAIGVDPAISKNPSADCTAAVSAAVCGWGDSLRVYILSNPVNERLTFLESENRLSALADALGDKSEVKLFIENVAFQDALVAVLKKRNYRAEGVPTGGMDKRERLAVAAKLVEAGKVFFPEKGCEALIAQLLGFGIEKHDDLVDAFSVLIRKIIDNDKEPRSLGLAVGDMRSAKIVKVDEARLESEIRLEKETIDQYLAYRAAWEKRWKGIRTWPYF